MSVKELIIHAGYPKTGTSALQTFLALNRERLLEEGFDYPTLGDPKNISKAAGGHTTSGNAVRLAKSLLPVAHDVHGRWSQLREERRNHVDQVRWALNQSPAESLILSSEYFFLWSPDEYRQLLTGLARTNLQLRLVTYIREQMEDVVSAYVQAIKGGEIRGNPAFKLGPKSRGFYDQYFDTQEMVTGREQISVRVYDRARLIRNDIGADFLDALGTNDLTGFEFPARDTNSGLSPAMVALKQSLNGMVSGAAFHQEFARIATLIPGATKMSYNLLPADIVSMARASFVQANERVMKRYLPDQQGPLFAYRPIDDRDLIILKDPLPRNVEHELKKLAAAMCSIEDIRWNRADLRQRMESAATAMMTDGLASDEERKRILAATYGNSSQRFCP